MASQSFATMMATRSEAVEQIQSLYQSFDAKIDRLEATIQSFIATLQQRSPQADSIGIFPTSNQLSPTQVYVSSSDGNSATLGYREVGSYLVNHKALLEKDDPDRVRLRKEYDQRMKQGNIDNHEGWIQKCEILVLDVVISPGNIEVEEAIHATNPEERSEIPMFTGVDLRPWLDWMEHRFASEEFTDLQKMTLAHGFIDEEAASWYNKRLSWLPFQSWEDLKTNLLLRFGDANDPDRLRIVFQNKRFIQECINKEMKDLDAEESVNIAESIAATSIQEVKSASEVDPSYVISQQELEPIISVCGPQLSDGEISKCEELQEPSHIGQFSSLHVGEQVKSLFLVKNITQSFLQAEEVTVECEKTNYGTRLLTKLHIAHQLLAKMTLRDRMIMRRQRVHHRKKRCLSPKSWRFKFKGQLEKTQRSDVKTILEFQWRELSSSESKLSGELGRMLSGTRGEALGTVTSVDLMRERAATESEIQLVFGHWKKNKSPKSWMFKFRISSAMRKLIQNKFLFPETANGESHINEVKHVVAKTGQQSYNIIRKVLLSCRETVLSCITHNIQKQHNRFRTTRWRTKMLVEEEHKHFSAFAVGSIHLMLQNDSESMLLKLLVHCHFLKGYGLSKVVRDFGESDGPAGTTAVLVLQVSSPILNHQVNRVSEADKMILLLLMKQIIDKFSMQDKWKHKQHELVSGLEFCSSNILLITIGYEISVYSTWEQRDKKQNESLLYVMDVLYLDSMATRVHFSVWFYWKNKTMQHVCNRLSDGCNWLLDNELIPLQVLFTWREVHKILAYQDSNKLRELYFARVILLQHTNGRLEESFLFGVGDPK